MGKLLYGQKLKKRSWYSIIRKHVKSVLRILHPRILLPPVIFVAGILTLIFVLTISLSSMDPSPIEAYMNKSVEWTGPFALNDVLQNARRSQAGKLKYPLAVAYDVHQNLLYVAEAGGKISLLKTDQYGQPGAGDIEYLTHVSTKPTAMRCDMGLLFVTDPSTGLHTIDPREKKSAVLVPLDVVTPPIRALSDACLSHKGIIYLVDSNLKYGSGTLVKQLLEGKCTGRIIAYSLVQNTSSVIKEGLCTPTSVEISKLGDELLISETGRGRVSVMRINDTEIVSHEYYPGLPGRLIVNRRRTMWLSVHAVKDSFWEYVVPRAWLRKLIGTLLPESLLRSLAFQYRATIVELHQNATPVESLQDSTGQSHDWITDVAEGPDGLLYLGNDNSEYLGRLGEMRTDSEGGRQQPPPPGAFDFDPSQFEKKMDL